MYVSNVNRILAPSCTYCGTVAESSLIGNDINLHIQKILSRQLAFSLNVYLLYFDCNIVWPWLWTSVQYPCLLSQKMHIVIMIHTWSTICNVDFSSFCYSTPRETYLWLAWEVWYILGNQVSIVVLWRKPPINAHVIIVMLWLPFCIMFCCVLIHFIVLSLCGALCIQFGWGFLLQWVGEKDLLIIPD